LKKSRDHVPVNWCAGQPLVSPEDNLAPSEGKGLRSPSGQEERVTGRRKEREKKEKTESVSTLTFWGYPCSYEKGVQVEVF
jgi:hypothetical protein